MSATLGVEYNEHRRRYMIKLTLTPDEADEVAYALGYHDAASRELHDAAEDARRLDERMGRRPGP